VSLLKEGGSTALAILALYMLNSVYRYVLDREKAYAAEIRDDKKEMLRVLDANTQASTRLAGAIENLIYGERGERAKSQN
jgi:hypothetical protein